MSGRTNPKKSNKSGNKGRRTNDTLSGMASKKKAPSGLAKKQSVTPTRGKKKEEKVHQEKVEEENEQQGPEEAAEREKEEKVHQEKVEEENEQQGPEEAAEREKEEVDGGEKKEVKGGEKEEIERDGKEEAAGGDQEEVKGGEKEEAAKGAKAAKPGQQWRASPKKVLLNKKSNSKVGKPISRTSSGAKAVKETVSLTPEPTTSPQASVTEGEPRIENERIAKPRPHFSFDWKLDEIAASWKQWTDAGVQDYWNDYGH